MREIEFRFWDNQIKELVLEDDQATEILLNIKLGVYEKKGSHYSNEDFIIEQYTGLKDKNGKKIFEGDKYKYIYRQPGKQRGVAEYGVVEFKKGIFMCINDSQETQNYTLSSMVFDIEIIGNIHERKE